MEHLADSAVYSSRVIEAFDAPRHAGAPSGATHAGEAISRARGAKLRLYLRVQNGKVDAAGFAALGCPHLIAAAELACEDLEGRDRGELAQYGAAFLDGALPLPPEKLDIRILVEDAVRDAAAGD